MALPLVAWFFSIHSNGIPRHIVQYFSLSSEHRFFCTFVHRAQFHSEFSEIMMSFDLTRSKTAAVLFEPFPVYPTFPAQSYSHIILRRFFGLELTISLTPISKCGQGQSRSKHLEFYLCLFTFIPIMSHVSTSWDALCHWSAWCAPRHSMLLDRRNPVWRAQSQLIG
jgi:hypothetical protein